MPLELVTVCLSAGAWFWVSPKGRLVVRRARRLTEDQVQALRDHRGAILTMFATIAAGCPHDRVLVQTPTGRVSLIFCLGCGALRGVGEQWPAAVRPTTWR